MIYLIFFVSGATALVYQVAWMKLLTVELGSTVYAVSTVLTVFMSGLALGSWWFGRQADRTARPLMLYATMEASLGLYAAALLGVLPLSRRLYVVLERAFEPSYQSFSVIKLGLALAALGLHRWRGPLAVHDPRPPRGDDELGIAHPEADLGARPALLIAFLSGFVVLACEVMWTRLMVNFLSGNALIFATVLAAVLTGLAAGGFLATFLVGRCRRLAPVVAGALLAGGTLLVGLVVAQPLLARMLSRALTSEARGLPFVSLFLVLLPLCTVLGVTFPTLIRLLSRGNTTVASPESSRSLPKTPRSSRKGCRRPWGWRSTRAPATSPSTD